MDSLVYQPIPEEIFNITEVEKLSIKTVEQAILVFIDTEKNMQVLCGNKFNATWTSAPSVSSIVNWLMSAPTIIHEAVVLHNHPGIPWHGAITPSREDIISTEFLKWQLALLGIKLLDHYIVTGNKKISLRVMSEYEYGGFIKISGFEIKQFLYSFLVQVSAVLKDSELELIIEFLEKNLDLLSVYYDKSYILRLLSHKPVDSEFKNKLTDLKLTDYLLRQLVNVLIQLDDWRNYKIQPEKVIPYGTELQLKVMKWSSNHYII